MTGIRKLPPFRTFRISSLGPKLAHISVLNGGNFLRSVNLDLKVYRLSAWGNVIFCKFQMTVIRKLPPFRTFRISSLGPKLAHISVLNGGNFLRSVNLDLKVYRLSAWGNVIFCNFQRTFIIKLPPFRTFRISSLGPKLAHISVLNGGNFLRSVKLDLKVDLSAFTC